MLTKIIILLLIVVGIVSFISGLMDDCFGDSLFQRIMGGVFNAVLATGSFFVVISFVGFITDGIEFILS